MFVDEKLLLLVLSFCLWVCRFFQCLQTLVGCGLSGPTSPLAFVEAVLGAISRSTGSMQNKEQMWRTWSVVVSPLTDTITQVSSTQWAVWKSLIVMHTKMAWSQVKCDEKDQNPTSANRIQHFVNTVIRTLSSLAHLRDILLKILFLALLYTLYTNDS